MRFSLRIFCLAALAVFCATNAHALLYWDMNGNTPGSGGPAPSGTWNLSAANWSGDDAGTNAGLWNGTLPAVFSAGTDATGSYTITVDDSGGQVVISDMHCDDGTPTIVGDPLMWNGGPQLISAAAGHVFTINCQLQNNVTNLNAFHKYKPGTVVLGGSNNFSGDVTIEGGTLVMAGNQRIPASASLVLSNGDDRSGDGYIDTPATFSTGGFNQTLGSLILDGPNSGVWRSIDFSNGNGTLSFADSSAYSWATTDNANNSVNPGPITLIITNFAVGSSKLRFGSNSNGVTAAQLSQMHFIGYAGLPGVIDSNGFVNPAIPVVQSIKVTGQTVQLTWSVVPNWSYEVEFKTNIAATWQNLGVYFTNGATASATDTLTPSQRYYRVQVLGAP